MHFEPAYSNMLDDSFDGYSNMSAKRAARIKKRKDKRAARKAKKHGGTSSSDTTSTDNVDNSSNAPVAPVETAPTPAPDSSTKSDTTKDTTKDTDTITNDDKKSKTIIISGIELSERKFPELYQWAKDNPETLKEKLNGLIKVWHGYPATYAAEALEESLEADNNHRPVYLPILEKPKNKN